MPICTITCLQADHLHGHQDDIYPGLCLDSLITLVYNTMSVCIGSLCNTALNKLSIVTSGGRDIDVRDPCW